MKHLRAGANQCYWRAAAASRDAVPPPQGSTGRDSFASLAWLCAALSDELRIDQQARRRRSLLSNSNLLSPFVTFLYQPHCLYSRSSVSATDKPFFRPKISSRRCSTRACSRPPPPSPPWRLRSTPASSGGASPPSSTARRRRRRRTGFSRCWRRSGTCRYECNPMRLRPACDKLALSLVPVFRMAVVSSLPVELLPVVSHSVIN